MLVGLSGCASFQQKGNWASPDAVSAFGTDGTESSPLSRLAFWGRPKAEPETPPAAESGSTDSGRTIAIADQPATSSSDRPKLFRHFPLLSRIWNGTGRSGINADDRTEWKPSTPVSSTGAMTFAPATSSGSRSNGSTPPARDPAGEVALRLWGRTPQVDTATIPARNRDTAADPAREPEETSPAPAMPDPAVQPSSAGTPPPQQIGGDDVSPPPPPSASGPAPAGSSPTATRGPALPSVSPEAPATSPAGSTTTSLPSTSLEPVWNPTSSIVVGSGQGVLTSGQSSFLSPTCTEPPGKKCNLLKKLCPLKNHGVMPSAQSAVTYQSCESSAPCKVKKPCFLKTFLHKATCPGKGCGCATGGCDAHELIATPQGITPTSQW
jgi:hypothetical protein